jgi:hypothetical protein
VTGAAVTTAVALLSSPAAVPLAAQRIPGPVHRVVRMTCDDNGHIYACKLCNNTGFVVQHHGRTVPVDQSCRTHRRIGRGERKLAGLAS